MGKTMVMQRKKATDLTLSNPVRSYIWITYYFPFFKAFPKDLPKEKQSSISNPT